MERNVVSFTDSSNPLEESRHDLGGDTTDQRVLHAEAAPSVPTTLAARMREIRKTAKAEAKDRRLGPKGWKDQLQRFIDENNWRHATKNKGVSFKTQDDRATFLFAAFKALYKSGRKFKPEPRNLTNKHVKYLVELWVAQGLSTGTLQVYMSNLRAFCSWIHHDGMIWPLEHYLPDPALAKRTCVAHEDKSWIAHGVVPEEKLAEVRGYDARAACWLRMYLVFGARLKEILMCRPHLAEVEGQLFLTVEIRARKWETYLELKRGTKGGRVRWVPIDTPEKRAVLEEAKRLAGGQISHLGHETKSLAQNIRRFKYVCEKFGIAKDDLGVTAHGLRHQYAAERYERFSGTPAPVRGGAPVAREIDRAARLRVADELGHSRENITGAYLGGILKQPASSESTRAAPASNSSEPAVDAAISEEKAFRD